MPPVFFYKLIKQHKNSILLICPHQDLGSIWLVVLQRKFTTISQKHYPDLSSGVISSDVISLGDQWCCHQFPFRKQWLPLLTVDATIGNQAFSHNRCNIFLGLSYNNRQILSTTKKCSRKTPSPQLESKPMATTFQILAPSIFLVVLKIYFITIGWLVNKANDMFLNSLRKNDFEAQVEFRLKVMERAWVTCYWCNMSSMRRSVPSPDEERRRELKIRRAVKYFWQTSRCFIWWWNTLLNACYYFSNKRILEGEIKDAKMSSFSSYHQTLIKH